MPTQSKPYVTLPPWNGPDIRVDGHQHMVPTFWGSRSSCSDSWHEESHFLSISKKHSHRGRDIRTHGHTAQVLPSTPYVKVLVRWALGKWLTNRLPNLSIITMRFENTHCSITTRSSFLEPYVEENDRPCATPNKAKQTTLWNLWHLSVL